MYFAVTNSVVAPLRLVTRTLPIVLVTPIDPVAVATSPSPARPGATLRFLLYEYGIAENGWSC